MDYDRLLAMGEVFSNAWVAEKGITCSIHQPRKFEFFILKLFV